MFAEFVAFETDGLGFAQRDVECVAAISAATFGDSVTPLARTKEPRSGSRLDHLVALQISISARDGVRINRQIDRELLHGRELLAACKTPSAIDRLICSMICR